MRKDSDLLGLHSAAWCDDGTVNDSSTRRPAVQPPPPLRVPVWQVARRALGQAIGRAARLAGLTLAEGDTSDDPGRNHADVEGAGVTSEPTHAGDDGDLASVTSSGLDSAADKKQNMPLNQRPGASAGAFPIGLSPLLASRCDTSQSSRWSHLGPTDHTATTSGEEINLDAHEAWLEYSNEYVEACGEAPPTPTFDDMARRRSGLTRS